MLGKGDNEPEVVSMTERDKQKRLAPLRRVEAYWQSLCGVDAVPLRSQIDPRGMEEALENAFLMERIASSMAKVRVAGSHLNDLMGMQVAGMPLSSFIAPSDRDKFGEAVTNLFADPAIVRMDLVAEGGFGKPGMEAHMILMPLRSDFGDVTRGLGALVSHGRIGRTPRRFTIRRIEVIEALRGKGVTVAPTTTAAKPARPLPTPAPTPASKPGGFAEAAAPFQARPSAPAKGHLRLIVDND